MCSKFSRLILPLIGLIGLTLLNIPETVIPKPLLERAKCPQKDQMGCADGVCLPRDYFCDGSMDCTDGSDEGHCDFENDFHGATPCDQSTCVLPDCFCSKDGRDVPANLPASLVPQMITLTFDDAVNDDNWKFYNDVLFTSEFRNPNACPIRATFFVSHQYNNYYYNQKLWNKGHEFAIHSITHRGPQEWWSLNATLEDWFDEMVGGANILNKFAKIRLRDIKGLRVPFLSIGWNRQFLMMREFGFVYDSSIIAPFSNPPFWPYTLDHRIPHKCTGSNQVCPSRSYKAVWELPMNPLQAGDFTCAMIDSCPSNLSGDEVYKILIHNFKRHYLSNRAPFGLYFHSSWFKNSNYITAFQKFMRDILKYPDVWFVTNSQMVEWMKKPTTIDKLNAFLPWKCHKHFKKSEMACDRPNVCKLYSRVFQQDRYLHTCSDCPAKYPWIRNEFGLD